MKEPESNAHLNVLSHQPSLAEKSTYAEVGKKGGTKKSEEVIEQNKAVGRKNNSLLMVVWCFVLVFFFSLQIHYNVSLKTYIEVFQ